MIGSHFQTVPASCKQSYSSDQEKSTLTFIFSAPGASKLAVDALPRFGRPFILSPAKD